MRGALETRIIQAELSSRPTPKPSSGQRSGVAASGLLPERWHADIGMELSLLMLRFLTCWTAVKTEEKCTEWWQTDPGTLTGRTPDVEATPCNAKTQHQFPGSSHLWWLFKSAMQSNLRPMGQCVALAGPSLEGMHVLRLHFSLCLTAFAPCQFSPHAPHSTCRTNAEGSKLPMHRCVAYRGVQFVAYVWKHECHFEAATSAILLQAVPLPVHLSP